MLTKTVVWMVIVLGTSKVLGLVREAVIAGLFGVGYVTDAYTLSLRIVTFAMIISGTVITTVFVPNQRMKRSV